MNIQKQKATGRNVEDLVRTNTHTEAEKLLQLPLAHAPRAKYHPTLTPEEHRQLHVTMSRVLHLCDWVYYKVKYNSPVI